MISEIKISQYFHNRLQRRDYGLSLKMFSDNIFLFFLKFISSSHFPQVFSSVPISSNYVRFIWNFIGIGEKMIWMLNFLFVRHKVFCQNLIMQWWLCKTPHGLFARTLGSSPQISWALPAHRLRVILQTFSQCYAFISIYLK